MKGLRIPAWDHKLHLFPRGHGAGAHFGHIGIGKNIFIIFAAGKVKYTEWMENTDYYVAPEARVLEMKMKMELLVVVSEEREYGQAIEI